MFSAGVPAGVYRPYVLLTSGRGPGAAGTALPGHPGRPRRTGAHGDPLRDRRRLIQWAISINDHPAKVQIQLALAHAAAAEALAQTR